MICCNRCGCRMGTIIAKRSTHWQGQEYIIRKWTCRNCGKVNVGRQAVETFESKPREVIFKEEPKTKTKTKKVYVFGEDFAPVEDKNDYTPHNPFED